MTPKRRRVVLVRVVCLGSALFWMAVLAIHPRLLERVELAALDTELAIAPPAPPTPEIIIVAVDERAVHRYGPLRWPPGQLAEVVTALDRLGAAVIAFDFVFTGEADRSVLSATQAREHMRPLRDAIAGSGRVVLGTYFDFQTDSEDRFALPETDLTERRVRQIHYWGRAADTPREFPPVPQASGVHAPLPELRRAARAFGHLNLLPSRDGIIRWMPLVVRYRDNLYTDFAVETACVYLSGPRKQVRGAPGPSDLGAQHEDLRPAVFVGYERLGGLLLGDRRIATDEHGRMLVRFAGPARTYATYSAADLLEGKLPAERVRGRIVLVGSTASGAADVWATPRDPLLPGVEIHANAIGNLLQGNFLVRNWFTRLLSYALLAVLGLAGALVLPRSPAVGLRRVEILAVVFVGALVWAHYEFFTRTGYALDVVLPLLATATLLGGTLAVNYFTEEKRRKQVERCFEHYLDRSVVTQLLESPERLRLGGERRELTVLFCDLRNFTTLAEEIPPEAAVEMLNQFFTTMTDVVLAHRGMVDKFVGDQIMAVWGAPLEDGNHAANACAAALGFMQAFRRLRPRWARAATCQGNDGLVLPSAINCGVGLNSGSMVVGNIGSSDRFSYTVIGDHVNVAARLESLNKLYGTQILAGPSTYAAARDLFRFREVDLVRVKGRTQELAVYELLARADEPQSDREWLEAFAEGLAASRREDWTAAARAFAHALARNPEDACAKYHLFRVQEMAQNRRWGSAERLLQPR